MRRKLALIFGTPFFITLILVWIFYEKQFSGIWPAIQKPEQDIAELIEKRELPSVEAPEQPSIPAPAENNTDFPLTLPDGFSISVFAKGLGKVRDLEWGSDGVLLASITDKGNVVALPDQNKDGIADEVVIIAGGLNRPHGLASLCTKDGCKFYIAESDQVAVYEYDQENLKAINKKKLADLPDGGRHYTRTLLFRPPPHSDELLVSIGSSCDTCHEEDERRAAIWTLNVKSGEFKPFAKGLRNAVFMANHPITDQLWVTEMGRDHLGDDLPPDEINIVEEDKNYGWPICYGNNIHDTIFDKNTYIRNPCMEPFEKPSYIDIQAHSAPLGLAFFPKEGWPEEYQNDLLVAYHGSWNRSIPTGYKVVRFKLDNKGNYVDREDFISGWLTPDYKSLGRPVDVLITDEGTIYISDDKAGVIYRVTFNAN